MKTRLIQGDCIEQMRILAEERVKVDMVLCDMPYGITGCKWDEIIPLDEMWDTLKGVCNKTTVICLFGAEPFSSHMRLSNLKMFKYDWIWEKSKASGFLASKIRPLKAHEFISVFYQKQPTYNPQFTTKQPYSKKIYSNCSITELYNYNGASEITISSDGKRYPRSIQYFKTAESEGRTFHPTQKPIALLEYLIKTYTNEGDTVLDFCMGSGSTGVACKNTGRNFIGIELDEEYFKIAEERIDETSR